LNQTKTNPICLKTPIRRPTLDEIITDAALVEEELSIHGGQIVKSEAAGDLSEEDDASPYQESDEALPDDTEEQEISRDPEREGPRFND
jgi:hypothetical protein